MSSCSFPCVRYKGIWREGGVTPRFLFCFRFRWLWVTRPVGLVAAKELGKHLVGGWVSSRNGPDRLGKRKSPFTMLGIEPRLLGRTDCSIDGIQTAIFQWDSRLLRTNSMKQWSTTFILYQEKNRSVYRTQAELMKIMWVVWDVRAAGNLGTNTGNIWNLSLKTLKK